VSWLRGALRALFGALIWSPQELTPARAGSASRTLLRWRRLGWFAVGVYALVISIVGSVQHVAQHQQIGWWPLLFALTASALLLAVRRPLDAWRLATATLVLVRLTQAQHTPPELRDAPLQNWQWFAYLPVLAAVGYRHRGAVVTAVGVLTALVIGWTTAIAPSPMGSQFYPITVLAVVAVLGVSYSVGARGRAQRALLAEEQRTAAADAEKAALAERARIAREMHDVVAHHMSLIAVRCETAPYRISALPEAGTREFAELGEAARQAITDLQGILGVLRATDQAADRAPQPGIGQLAALVRETERSGVRVTLTVSDAAADGVSDAVGLSVYRIAQEALTNARRHAPGAAVRVTLTRAAGALELVVRNGPGDHPGAGGGGGNGLPGMRERVAAHGGTLAAQSTVDGGFEVRATFPVPAATGSA
jgi:signal transduction histidine kinase